MVDADCSELFAQDLEPAKDSTAEGACSRSVVGFTARYCPVDVAWDVHCDSLERNTCCTAIKSSSGVYGVGEGDTLYSSNVGVTASWRDCPVGNTCCNEISDPAAIDRVVHTSGLHGTMLGPSSRGRLLFQCLSVDTKPRPGYATCLFGLLASSSLVPGSRYLRI